MKKIDLINNILVLLYAKGVNMIASMVYGMILVRAISKEEYGSFSQAQIAINICIVIFGLSFPNSINYFLPKCKTVQERRDILSQIVLLTNLAGIIAALCLLTGGNIISRILGGDITTLLAISCLLPLSRMISPLFDNFFVICNKTKKVASRRTMMSIIQVITVSLIWFFNFSIGVLLLIITITEILIALYVIISIYKEVGGIKFLKFDWVIIKAIFIFSLPLAVASFIGTLNTEINKILVSRYYGIEQLAEYSIMSKELPLTIIASSVTAVFIPQISKLLGNKDYKGAVDMWKKSIEITYLANSWIIGVLIVLSHECVQFLYSTKYFSGVPVFQIFNVVLLFRLTYFGMVLNGSGQSKKIFLSAMIGFISNIILFFILNPLIGYKSASISVLISVFVMNLSQIVFSSRVTKVKLRDIFPYKKITIIICVNFLIGLLVFILKKFILDKMQLNYILSLFLLSSLWLVLYAMVFFKQIIRIKKDLIVNE